MSNLYAFTPLFSLVLNQIMYSTHRPPSARPVTPLPITAPEPKATCRPSAMLRSHACAVRALAEVAVYMPRKPAAAESTEPTM